MRHLVTVREVLAVIFRTDFAAREDVVVVDETVVRDATVRDSEIFSHMGLSCVHVHERAGVS